MDAQPRLPKACGGPRQSKISAARDGDGFPKQIKISRDRAWLASKEESAGEGELMM